MSGRAGDVVAAAIRDAGGLPSALGTDQVTVGLGFGTGWQLDPVVDGAVLDEFGLDEQFRVRAELDQAVVRSWTRDQQVTGLLAVTARCLLSVLPDDHGARAELERAATAGAPLLPAP